MANLQRFYLKKDEHTYWTLPVEPGTTAHDICDAIASKLELKSGSCTLLESKTDKKATWEREVVGAEKILAVQSKWNPKKYSEKFVVVKPQIKVIRKEHRNSAHIPTSNDDKLIDDSWKEKVHEGSEVLKREVQILAEANSDLQQQLFEEKQMRNAMQNSSEVVKRLMEAEQQVDDLRVAVSDMQEISNHLEVENTQLILELKEAAHVIGGPYEEKVTAMQRTTKPIPRSRINPSNPSHPSSSSSSAGPPRVYFEGNRSENSPDYLRRQQDRHNMTSNDFDRHLEVASLGLDFAELQKSQRARERALEESKQKLREELDLSKQRRSDVLRESNHLLLEELEAIKSKSDLSKKKFVDSLHASKKKLEQELDVIEKKRRAQEEVRWSRPMDGYSSALSPSMQDGFSISPSTSPSPARRELGSPAKFDSPLKYDSPPKFDSSDGVTPTPSPMFSSPSDRPSTPNFSSRTDRATPSSPSLSSRPSASTPTTERYTPSKTDTARLSPQLSRFSSLLSEGSPSSRRELFSK